MADLIDRLSGHDGEKIPVHQFIAGLRLYAAGDVTAVEVSQDFGLEAGSQTTQATLLKDSVDNETGALNKLIQVLKIEAVAFKLEDTDDTIFHNPDGTINKSKVDTILGI